MALAVAFLLGTIASGPAWVIVGAIVADSLHTRRRSRRRATIDRDGIDAVESWLAAPDWTTPTNGTPFEGDEVA